jgi:predicted hotdog family 3-hydroxylacyl-ACP dehydratase
VSGSLPGREEKTVTLERLYERLPYGVGMRLIDELVFWDASTIRCRSNNHRNPDNPLRCNNSLPSLCMLEYAAQSLALHGLLQMTSDNFGGEAMVATSSRLECDDIDVALVPGPLEIRATWRDQAGPLVCYTIEVTTDARKILSGDLGVLLPDNDRPKSLHSW